ncbi:hypothetical protein [Mesorhizobium sp. LjNodule214]|uniref:hypothetical protein n=1 Tax=Mesorhizobium sp. LjNodule214 TaxID=3342252 RepID=UPI003ECF4580
MAGTAIDGTCSTTVESFVDHNGTTAAGIIAMRENGFDTAIEAGPDAASQTALEQFQEKCAAVFRPELRKNKSLERVGDSIKS